MPSLGLSPATAIFSAWHLRALGWQGLGDPIDGACLAVAVIRVQERTQACIETYLIAKRRQPKGLATFLRSHHPWDMEVGTCGPEPPKTELGTPGSESTWRHRQGCLGPRQQQTGQALEGGLHTAIDSWEELVWGPPRAALGRRIRHGVSRGESGAWMPSWQAALWRGFAVLTGPPHRLSNFNRATSPWLLPIHGDCMLASSCRRPGRQSGH